MSKLAGILPLPSLECESASHILSEILRLEITRTGIEKAVIGLSGGIDSALSLFLAVKALGPANVTAIFMPYKSSVDSSRVHSEAAARTAGVELLTREITPMADPYFESLPGIDRMRRGNVLARLRMILLYDLSAERRALVVGTSNKTEMLLGYSTLWGDMASAVNPIGDLYKFQVRELSAYLGVPPEIIDKAPSADLWEGQTDEEELDISYDLADRILYYWADCGWKENRLARALEEAGLGQEPLERVLRMVRNSQFKRKMPLIAKVSRRTVDREFRYPRDWGL